MGNINSKSDRTGSAEKISSFANVVGGSQTKQSVNAVASADSEQPFEGTNDLNPSKSTTKAMQEHEEKVRRIVKQRFQQQDWAMGKGVVEEEMLVQDFQAVSSFI